MKSIGHYWYKSKQVIIPTMGLALLLYYMVYLDNCEKREREVRKQTSPTYVVPAGQYTDRAGNVRTATRPEDGGW